MQKVLRTGILGLGNIGYRFALDAQISKKMKFATHYQTIKSHPNFKLVSVCDQNVNSIRYFISKSGEKVEAFTSVDKMLDECKVDLLVVATPTGTHAEICERAIKRKTPLILCEKPISFSYDEARRIVTRAQQNDTFLIFNYFRNFSPSYVELIKKVKSGHFGEIQSFYGVYTRGVYNNCSHLLALLIKFLGDDMLAVAVGKKIYDKERNDPTVSLALKYGDQSGFIQGLDGRLYNTFELKLFLQKAVISVKNDELLLFRVKRKKAVYSANYLEEAPTLDKSFNVLSGLFPVYTNIYESYRNKSRVLFTSREALKVLEIISNSLKIKTSK